MTNEEYFCVAIMTLFCQGCLWVSCAYPNEAFPFGRIGRAVLYVNSIVLLTICFATLTYGLLKGALPYFLL